METKKYATAVVLLFMSTSCVSQDHDFKSDSEETLFKNFTLSVCLNTAYGQSSQQLLNEASKAANGYREFGHIALDAYQQARQAVDIWLKKDYSSKSGGQIEIMKCIDLYNSDELSAVFEKYDPCKTKEAWLDQEEFKSKCEK